MEFHIIPDKEALSKCVWCQSHISDDMEVFGCGAKLKPNINLSEYENHCIQIGMVSEEGKDGMFLVCSKRCGEKLKSALEKEISLGKMFKTFWFE